MAATIQNTDCVAHKLTSEVNLVISTTGLTISVDAGSFTWTSSTRNLIATDHVVAVDPTDPTDVVGMLVLDVNDDALVLVDEIIIDGIDLPYDFSASSYVLLHTLFIIRVPAAAANLDGLTLNCFNVIHPS